MAEVFPHERLDAVVRRYFPRSGELRFVAPPGGKHNSTYLVEGAPRQLVLRISPDPCDDSTLLFYERRMMRQEPALHAILRRANAAPVPEILAHSFDDLDLGRDLVVMERLPGQMLGHGPGNPSRTLRELGAALSRVHRIHGERYGYDGAQHVMKPTTRWCDAFRVLWNRLIDDIVDVGAYEADGEARRLRELFDLHSGVFEHDPPSSLLHMDVWTENILADEDGRLTGLVDWDRALWGDPEIEYAVLDYCGISEPPFWEGYGLGGDPRASNRDAALRRVFYWLYEHQKYIFIRIARRGDRAGAARYRSQSLDVASRVAGWRGA